MSETLKTPELLEAERQQNIHHAKFISEVTLAVEKVLLDNDLTMSDYAEVVATLNMRAQKVFNETKISQVKDAYDRRTE